MNILLRYGAYATFLGFFMVGISFLFSNSSFYFGLGWIVVGIGLPLSLVGLDVSFRSGAASRATLGASAAESAQLIARKVPKAESDFVCSDCGGDITADMKVCPHCGAAIEGDDT